MQQGLIFRSLKAVYRFFYNLRRVHGRNNTITGIARSKVRIYGNDNRIECLSPHIGQVRIIVYGNGHRLTIGEKVIYKKGLVWFEDSSNEIVIGNGTTLEDVNLAAAEQNTSIRIGDDCMFSSGIRVSTTDSHSIIDLETGQRINPASSIAIGGHVWIGTRVSINKGVSIGDDSVVAANSVVTRDVPANTVAAGIPAKTIKQNTTWLRERLR